jgi:hypothetical protein
MMRSRYLRRFLLCTVSEVTLLARLRIFEIEEAQRMAVLRKYGLP